MGQCSYEISSLADHAVALSTISSQRILVQLHVKQDYSHCPENRL
jgi:hypothetical protein